MSYPVYHFTDTLHLPWIVKSGELRPNLNRLKGIGDIEYLWATTNPDGDKTARALIERGRSCNAELYEFQKIQVVRFTLPSAGFIPWRDIKRKSTWTAEQIAELEASDRRDFGEHGHAKWRCRRKPLPIQSALKVEAKLYGDYWEPIKPTRRHLIKLPDDHPIMGITVRNVAYYSTSSTSWLRLDGGRLHGVTCYELPDREELAEFLDKMQEALDEFS